MRSILAVSLLCPATSLISPSSRLLPKGVGQTKIHHQHYGININSFARVTKGQSPCAVGSSSSIISPSSSSTAHFMSDIKIKTSELDEDEEVSGIYEDIDGLSRANFISLNESVLPLDNETKEIADKLGENLVSEIINKEEPLTISLETEKASTVEEIDKPVATGMEARRSPGVRKIIKFAVPAIGVWLCGPILSLIDTSAVGLLAGTKQQAGLNPAVAVCDYSALLMAFLYTGTTNMVATAQEEEVNSVTKPNTAKTLISVLQLSGYVGLLLCIALLLTSKHAILGIMGSEVVDPEVFAAALKYVNIRALGMPAAAIIGSSQAACLGMQDIKSPLYVLAAAAVINFFGDAIFVGSKLSWLGGAAGAAWATVFSQYAALFFFIKWLTVKKTLTVNRVDSSSEEFPPELQSGSATDAAKRVKVTEKILKITSSSEAAFDSKREKLKSSLKKLHKSIQKGDEEKKSTFMSSLSTRLGRMRKKNKNKPSNSEKAFSTRGFLEGRFRGRYLLKLPTKAAVDDFKPYVVPVTMTSVGRVSAYVAMAHVVASSLGTLSMAAQQIITSLFYCLTPVADSLSLTAQSFVPSIYEKRGTPEGADVLWNTTKDFIKAGGIFGLFIATIVSCIPLLGGFFTSDLRVTSLVNSVVPTLAAIFTTHGVVCATEGALLGQKDLSFLGKAYACYFFAVPYLMLRVKNAAIAGKQVSVASLWKVFLGYNIFRMCFWVARTKMLANRSKRLAIVPTQTGKSD